MDIMGIPYKKNHEVDKKFGGLGLKFLAKEAATDLMGIPHEIFIVILIRNLVDCL